jgi:predicted DsbA family dithiol-disulfide isomerase
MAMDEVKDKYDFKVGWKPFLLRPNMPMTGKAKPPNTPDNPRVNPRMKAAGAAVGIDFTGLCDVYPNTVRAHVLLSLVADRPDIQDKLADNIFYGYYTAGENPNDIGTLLTYAKGVGLEEKSVADALENPAKRQQVMKEASLASQQGISGVPYFFLNSQPYFSGAQSPSAFVKAFQQAAQEAAGR